MTLLAYLSFIGTDYHGFQIQKNAVTVQSVFQDALKTVLGFLPDIKGCSRTDSGVHANMYCVSFCADADMERLQKGLNALLPQAVRVIDIRAVPDGFHARYSCIKKRYVYLVSDAPVMSPFLYGRAYSHAKKLDEKKMNEAAALFVGRHDFSAFCGAAGKKDDCRRTMFDCSVERERGLVRISITADGFLYNMARIIVGTLLSFADGKLTAEDIKNNLASGARTNMNKTAPACGLYLDEVFYDFGN